MMRCSTAPCGDRQPPPIKAQSGRVDIPIGQDGPEARRDVGTRREPRLLAALRAMLGPDGPASLAKEELGEASWGWLPALSLIAALGLAAITVALWIKIDISAPMLFWGGLLLIYLPVALRIGWPATSRREQIALLLLAAMMLYAVRIVRSPLHVNSFDEFLHWVTADDILMFGNLFTPNPLLPISPLYPALEILVTASTKLTGLSLYASAIVIIGALRGLFICSLYLLFERIAGSSRLAALACAIYMGNSGFVFFDTAFAYESLGIFILVLVLLAALQAEADVKRHWIYVFILALPLLCLLATTHHVTAFVGASFLVAAAGLVLLSPAAPHRRPLALTLAAAAVLAALIWSLSVGNPSTAYLSPALHHGLGDLYELVLNFSLARKPFVAADGASAPLWQRLTAFSAVALIALALISGFFRALKVAGAKLLRNGGLPFVSCANPWLVLFTLLSALYPVTIALRLTVRGWEIGNRAGPFVFFGVAPVAAIAILLVRPRQSSSPWRIGLLGLALTTVFFGGILSSWGTNEVPRRYRVSADAASIEPMGIDTAEWTRQWLGPQHRFVTDLINRLLLATYGRQRVLTKLYDPVDTSAIVFAERLGPEDRNALQVNNVEYLLVDLRLSQALPRTGAYFEKGEDPKLHAKPPNPAALLKFDQIKQVSRPFDNGYLIIYDVTSLVEALRHEH